MVGDPKSVGQIQHEKSVTYVVGSNAIALPLADQNLITHFPQRRFDFRKALRQIRRSDGNPHSSGTDISIDPTRPTVHELTV
jgi:hypothetical protein